MNKLFKKVSGKDKKAGSSGNHNLQKNRAGCTEEGFINNNNCHHELCSGSCHRQKYSGICNQKTNVGQKAKHTLMSVLSSKRRFVMKIQRLSLPGKAAFTLAEVLITLGIIGVVAAMTLPGLITEYRHKTLETGLARFYSVINQALNASAIDNGDPKYWNYTDNSCEFYKTYLAKYLKTTSYECGFYNGKSKVNDERFVGIYFPSGDMAVFSYGSKFIYILKAKKYYYAYNALISGSELDKRELYGRELFVFELRDPNNEGYYYEIKKYGVEPFGSRRRYSREESLQRCIQNPAMCVEVIRRNGWKIPDNYPYTIK